MAELKPFRIAVPDDVLADLRPPGRPVGQRPNASTTGARASRWPTRVNSRRTGPTVRLALPRGRAEPFDQFTTEIDGLRIHFIHQRSPHADAFPLVITHGWPGSIVEFQKVIAPLTNRRRDAPRTHSTWCARRCPATGSPASRDATGWNVAQDRRGLGNADGATRLRPLWRAGRRLGRGRDDRDRPQRGHCAAIHTNMPIGGPDGAGAIPPRKRRPRWRRGELPQWGTGYFKQQSTRPQTLGYGLVDSPPGNWPGSSRSSGRGPTATAT